LINERDDRAHSDHDDERLEGYTELYWIMGDEAVRRRVLTGFQ